jgi:hypothetical protein
VVRDRERITSLQLAPQVQVELPLQQTPRLEVVHQEVEVPVLRLEQAVAVAVLVVQVEPQHRRVGQLSEGYLFQ